MLALSPCLSCHADIFTSDFLVQFANVHCFLLLVCPVGM